MSYAIHHVTPENAGLLARVAEDVFDEAIRPGPLAGFLADPNHVMFVAVENEEVIGQIRGIVHLQPDRASDLYIDNLGVTPTQQRRGVAAALLDEMLAWSAAKGCGYVWVATETDNAGGMAFYEAQAFSGRRLAWFDREIESDGQV